MADQVEKGQREYSRATEKIRLAREHQWVVSGATVSSGGIFGRVAQGIQAASC